MTTFPAAIASILALTALGWFVRRASRWPLCPVCLGVSGTWLWLLGARLAGFAVEPAVLALLLGASAVAAVQWVEARLPARSPLLWKALALPAGLVAAYGLVAERWDEAALGAAVLAVLAVLFLRTRAAAPVDPAVVAELEERMKKCC